jgi:hypothetical protein
MASRTLSLFLIGGGVLLAWSGVSGKQWSSVFRDVISGKDPKTALSDAIVPITAAPITSDNLNQTVQNALNKYGTVSSASEAKNRALAKAMAAAYGWSTGPNWNALNYGWGVLESGFDNKVYNGGVVGGPYQPDKAYGIPQALGHGPNGAPYPAGNPGNPPGAGGVSSATGQIAWGLKYIKDTYGSPSRVPGWTGGPYSGY